MSTTWRWMILGGGLGVYLAGLGILGGIAPELARFNQDRTIGLDRYDEAAPRRHANLVRPQAARAAERAGKHAPWTPHLRRVDEALAQKDVRAAIRAWRDAYSAALRSGGWEGMLEVGDAYLRIGEVAGTGRESEAEARRSYLAALSRARRQGSLDGVLRTAEAFAALGDREAVDQCIRIAEYLAAQDPEAQADVREFQEQLMAEFSADEGSRSHPVPKLDR